MSAHTPITAGDLTLIHSECCNCGVVAGSVSSKCEEIRDIFATLLAERDALLVALRIMIAEACGAVCPEEVDGPGRGHTETCVEARAAIQKVEKT